MPTRSLMRFPRATLRWLTVDRYAWQRRLLAYLLVVSAFAGCLTLIQQNYRADTARSCRDRATGREVLRELVIAAYTGAAPDYSRIPSYNALDPETKQFLRDLGTFSTRPTDRLDSVLSKVPPVTCP